MRYIYVALTNVKCAFDKEIYVQKIATNILEIWISSFPNTHAYQGVYFRDDQGFFQLCISNWRGLPLPHSDENWYQSTAILGQDPVTIIQPKPYYTSRTISYITFNLTWSTIKFTNTPKNPVFLSVCIVCIIIRFGSVSRQCLRSRLLHRDTSEYLVTCCENQFKPCLNPG